MSGEAMPKFVLQRWSEGHRRAFVDMHADPAVTADLDGPLSPTEADAKFDRYRDAWTVDGIGRWAVAADGAFLGYAGIMRAGDVGHPLGVHHEIGWRFRRSAWGRGLATESARRALSHAWSVLPGNEILAYTAADNARSRRVMERLGSRREPARDFTARYPRGEWAGLVWVTDRPVT